MNGQSLVNYYQTNFQLMQHHNYSLYDLENMMPYERDVYVAFLTSFLKEEDAKNTQ